MKYDNIKDLVSSKNIIIPMYMYKLLPKIDIDYELFIFLMYLNQKGNNERFDAKGLSEDFACDMKKIIQYISSLQSKKLLELKVIPDENGIMREFLCLDLFYEKLSLLLIGKINEKKVDNSSVFKVLENELNKQLTPIETEIVKAWKENGYSDELIKEAIKEAVYNGVSNLRYIDKILYEWSKKNIKTKEDVEKNKKNFRAKEKETKIEKIELFEYDWMNDSANQN